MLSELPDTAPVDVSVAPVTVPVAVSAAQETAPEASTPVVNTSVQFTSLRSSWSQPTLPCAVRPSRVAEPVRARETDSLKGAGPDLQAVQVQRARRVQARRAPDTLHGRAEEGAGDAHVVVVGRADVHHQVGGRAQPVPAAEGVAQGVGAHVVPGRHSGSWRSLQLEASHHEAGLPNVVSVGSSSTSPRVASVTSSAPPSRNSCFSSRAEAPPPPLCCRPSGLRPGSGGHRRPPFLPSGQARRLEVRPKFKLRNSVWRHGEAHLGRAPGALVSREDVVGLGHVHHEVGGRAEPVAAGEEELPAGGQSTGSWKG